MRIPPLYALKAFEAASRHQSFTKAANELSITQSAVSKHIHTLELFFDCRLFIRNGSKVILTQEGECFSKEIQVVFNALNIACGNFYCDKNKLHISAPATFSLRWFIEVINKFQTRKEQEIIKLDNNALNVDVVDFKSNKYDCAIQFGSGKFPSDWRVTRLLDEWIIPVCTPDCLQKNEDITSSNYNVLYPKFQKGNWSLWCDRNFGKKITDIRNGYEFNTIDATISAAVQGLGIAIVDINMVLREINNKTLIFPVKSAVRTGNAYFFVWPQTKDNNKCIALLNDYLKKSIIEYKLGNVKYMDL